jgi:hypothetical protein
MKHSPTVLADAPSTSLKLAYSYLIPEPEILFKEDDPEKISIKPSPYKALFLVNPVISNAVSWDLEWYNNYE